MSATLRPRPRRDFAGRLAGLEDLADAPRDDDRDEPADVIAYARWADREYVASPGNVQFAGAFPEPENRGTATLSEVGSVEYVEDLIRPGRILVAAAEEGTGKSYAMGGELAIRVAVAGGSFAGTWPVLSTGPVLVLSEMHPDDDYQREESVLAALGRTRADLDGRYFRLNLMTAAHGVPALMDDRWREFITRWMAEHGTLLLVIDTGTAATGGNPWGPDIQQVYRNLREMLEALPGLAIAIVVHLKKPGQGQGGNRGLSAVMGEWGRWNDITVMMENDGASLERVKITVRKRVRRERRILVTKRDGLLVDPVDMTDGSATKVPIEDVVEAIRAEPGIDAKTLAQRLKVTPRTAQRYAVAAEAGGRVRHESAGSRGAHHYHVEERVEQLLIDAELDV